MVSWAKFRSYSINLIFTTVSCLLLLPVFCTGQINRYYIVNIKTGIKLLNYYLNRRKVWSFLSEVPFPHPVFSFLTRPAL